MYSRVQVALPGVCVCVCVCVGGGGGGGGGGVVYSPLPQQTNPNVLDKGLTCIYGG